MTDLSETGKIYELIMAIIVKFMGQNELLENELEKLSIGMKVAFYELW